MRSDGVIRVLIISDLSLFARALAAELEQHAGIHALLCRGDQAEVRDNLLQHHPDVILLDLALRELSALDLLRRLRANYPVPVIVLAESVPADAKRAVQAIERGALEVVTRPPSSRPDTLRPLAEDLAGKVRMATCLARPVPPVVAGRRSLDSFEAAGVNSSRHVIALGASTGGTRAIEVLLRRMAGDSPPVVIVQHMPVGFTNSFAERLNRLSTMSVSEAVDGEALVPGHAVIARGDTHLVVRRGVNGWRVYYTHQEPVNRHCPSVDVLFNSVAETVGGQAVGILLTGMGDDGARGLLRMREAGALTIAQDKASSVVYGMPKVAVELGAVAHSAAPEDIPALILRALREQKRGRMRPVAR